MNQLAIYFDSAKLNTDAVNERVLKTDSQNVKILELFANNPYVTFTPADVWLRFGQQWPLTSVRRAITTLEKKGFLDKTDEMRLGVYGDLNHTWKLKPQLKNPTV